MNLKELILKLSTIDYTEVLTEVKTKTDDDFTSQIVRLDLRKNLIIINVNKSITSQCIDLTLFIDGSIVSINAKINGYINGGIIKISDANLIKMTHEQTPLIDPVVVTFSLLNTFILNNSKQTYLSCEYEAISTAGLLYFNVNSIPTAEFLSSSLNGIETKGEVKNKDGATQNISFNRTLKPSPNFVKLVINNAE